MCVCCDDVAIIKVYLQLLIIILHKLTQSKWWKQWKSRSEQSTLSLHLTSSISYINQTSFSGVNEQTRPTRPTRQTSRDTTDRNHHHIIRNKRTIVFFLIEWPVIKRVKKSGSTKKQVDRFRTPHWHYRSDWGISTRNIQSWTPSQHCGVTIAHTELDGPTRWRTFAK